MKVVSRRKSLLLSSAAFAAFSLPAFAQTPPALPGGGQVAAGQATIGASVNNTLTITQSSQAAIIGWQSFSIGQGGTVQFNNGSGATLNRVTGNVPSQIDGLLSATGSVYLVNPAGVAVGTSGRVATGGSFIASTQDVSNAEFMAGKSMTFRGTSEASVVNYGKIGSLGGDVALIARQVENHGDISAPKGTAALAAGYEVLMRDASLSDGKFMVQVGGASTAAKTVGSIKAAEVELRANGGNVYALAGNTSGITKATGVANKGGRVFLTAGSGSVTVTQKIVARKAAATPKAAGVKRARDGGAVTIAADQVHLGGTLDVAGKNGGNGGKVTVNAGSSLASDGRIDATGSEGGQVSLAANSVIQSGAIKATGDAATGGTVDVLGSAIALNGATLDASGATGGGTIRVGGDWQGGGTLRRAETTSVDAATTLRADAMASGNGGTVVVWSDGTTAVKGTITARGGREGGNGGMIETSGHTVDFFGVRIDASAPNGFAGQWLIDPSNLTVDTAAATIIAAALNGGTDTVLQTTVNSVSTGPGVETPNGAGDITVAAPIAWASSAKLTLDAYHSIAIDAPVTIAGAGGLDLTTNHGGSGGTLTFAGGVQYTGAPNSGQSLTINSQPYTLLYSMSDVQNINNNLSGRYALAKPLDATGVTGWTPLGTDGVGNVLNGSQGFAGTFTGLGNTISNLMVDIGSSMYAGLFGWSKGAISDVGLVGGSVKGGNYVGGLVGLQYGSSITQAYATGTVTGGNNVGGLVGHQAGSIIQSYATGAVTGTDAYVGGLVGYQVGDITQSYATGAVRGRASVGGLVGWQYGSITQSYATGAVTGTGDYVGGLVGVQYDTITQSYATGAVTGIGASVGGLVGSRGNVGILIFNSYFDSYSTGRAASNGVGNVTNASGVTAVTSDPAQAGATNYAYKQSAYSNLTFTITPGGSGWYMIDGQTRPFGAWEYSTAITNAHQLQLVNMDLNASYTLARNIDLAGAFPAAGIAMPTRAQSAGMWRGGFVPLGTDGASNVLNGGKGFAGTFTGLGNTISNLMVDIGNNDYAGLFGWSNGAISNVGLVGGSVTGLNGVGGLVGYQRSGSITQAYATGTVKGSGAVGGLVGRQLGSITQSYATGKVEGGGVIGGLVGSQDSGSITQSYATGKVEVGGSYAGGLVGSQSGGNIELSYATGTVTGTGNNVGGLVGYQDSGSITQAYATGAVTGRDAVGGLVGYQRSGSVTQAYAAGTVGGVSRVGGLVGSQNSGSITAGYFDSSSTGRGASNGVGNIVNAPGVTALSSADGSAFVKANYAGFDWTVWAPPSAASGGTPAYYPQLFGVSGVVGVDYGTRTATYGDALASFGVSAVYGIGYFNTWTTAPESGSVASLNAGTYAIGGSGAAAAFTPGGASRIVDLGTLTITPATLTVTAKDASKVYDGQVWSGGNGVTYSGFVNGESDGVLSGTVAYGGASQGKKDVGTYAITPSGLSSGNYAITYVDGMLGITARALTVTAAGQDKVYDGTTAASVTFGDNRVANDDLTVGGTAVFGDKNVGAGKTVTVSGIALGGMDASNYTVNSTASTSADITPRSLTVTASGQDKVYDGTTAASVTYGDNRVVGDTLTIGGTASFGDKNVGIGKTVSVSGIALGGADAGNYTVNSTASTSADITARSLTVTASGQDKVYDGTTAASVTYGDNRVVGDTLTIGGTASFGDKNVGAGKTVSVSGIALGGADAGNYTVNSTASTSADITARSLTVTASGQDKVYDGTTAASVTYGDNRVVGDTLTIGGTASFGDKNVGAGKTVSVSGIALGGADAGNYTVNSTASTSADITARSLTVTASGQDKVYDGTTAASVTYGDNRVVGDTLTIGGTASFGDKNAGIGKTVSVSGIALGGADAGNYTVNSTASTSADITARSLTVTAAGQDKVYDGTTMASVTYGDNRIANDDLTIGGTASFGDKNVGAGKTVSVSGIALGGMDASNYTVNSTASTSADITARALTVTASGQDKVYDGATTASVTYGDNRIANDDLTVGGTASFGDKNVGTGKAVTVSGIVLGGMDASNYTVNSTAMTAADITPRSLTVTAAGQDKVYDGTTAASVTFGDNRIANDDLTIAGTAAFGDKNVGAGKTLSVAGITLGGADAGNYTFNTTATATADITARPVTVTADAQQKITAQPDPALTWQVTSGNLVNGDALSGSLTRAAGETAGSYAITQGTLSASANYALSFVGNTLVIVPAPVQPSNPSFDQIASQPPTVFEHGQQGGPSGLSFFLSPIAEVERAAAGNDRTKSSLPSGCASGLLAGQCAGFPHPDNLNFGLWLSVSAN